MFQTGYVIWPYHVSWPSCWLPTSCLPKCPRARHSPVEEEAAFTLTITTLAAWGHCNKAAPLLLLLPLLAPSLSDTTEEVTQLLHARDDGGRLERKLVNIGQGECTGDVYRRISHTGEESPWLKLTFCSPQAPCRHKLSEEESDSPNCDILLLTTSLHR